MITTLIVLLLATVGRTHSTELKTNFCEGISNYKCNETSDNVYLYHPDLDDNVRFSLDFGLEEVRWYFFDIECKIPAQFKFKIFPQLNLNLNVTVVGVRNCSIPEEDSFGSILEHFGIKTLVASTATNVGHSVQHLFSSGCENLENLDVSSNGLKHLNENVFDTLTMLTRLNLESNNISVLHRNVFKNLHNLDWLSLEDNQLETIEEGIFTHQNKLTFLSLSENKLKNLNNETFTGLYALTELNLYQNDFKKLPSDVFLNLPLTFISFGNTNIKNEIPKNIFETNYDVTSFYLERVKIPNGFLLNFTALKTLQIRLCKFEQIDDSSSSSSTNTSVLSSYGRAVHTPFLYLFADHKYLRDLDLIMNEITDLHDGLFDNLKELQHLSLSHNNLSTISGLIFRQLTKLFTLRLDNNHLKTISSSAFMNHKQLEMLDLSQNQLVFSGNESPFSSIDELRTLYIRYNNLTEIPPGLKNKKNTFMLDLGFNNIASYKYGELRDAMIHYTPKDIYNDKLNNFKLNEVYLNNNSLKCDCSLYEILWRQENSHDSLRNHMLAICADDKTNNDWCDHFEDTSMKCPVECRCEKRSKYDTNGINVSPRIIYCNYQELTTVPSIDHLKSHSLELFIDHNNLEELPNLQHNLYVIVILASNNNIHDIKVENLPPNLRALDMSHNKIKRISANVFDSINNLKSLEIVFISGNSFECDCSIHTDKLIQFVKQNISITDLQDVKTQCQVSGAAYEFSSDVLQDLCWYKTKATLLILLSTVLVIIGILVSLFYKYKQILLIWLYAHNVFLWFVDEDELDKGKKFDAFITCSFGDDDEIAARIANELEDDNLRFKVCVDERDWMPGKPIAQLIAESMDSSRRTIIILSKNFLKSMWGEHEFHCAYANGLAEKRMRLIIVLCEDIGNIKELDPTTKSYLKANTCIKWGDSWFWEKLRYALPRRRLNS